nr:leucine-rich repeat-containing protein 38 [Marmota flaviventris]
MRPPAAPRRPAAALGLCSLLLLLGPGHACPAGCACTDPHTVDCRDRGLPSVPDPFPLDVRKLLVAGNRIQQIPEDFFIFYGDLVYLDFRNNSLRSLEEGTFSGSAKLAFLDLSYNNLTQLGAGAFRSAGRLVKLSLANNNLAGVHEAAFETLESLQVLELNDNNLRRLNVAVLDALPALRTLRLDGNPWLCDCDFAHLFSWIQENASKLPKGELGRLGGREREQEEATAAGIPARGGLNPEEESGGSSARGEGEWVWREELSLISAGKGERHTQEGAGAS